MDILGQAKKALAALADSASQQAEYLKLQTRLGKLDDEKQRQLIEVGKRAHELWRMRKIQDKALDILIKRITEIEQEMEDLREEIIRHGQEPDADSS